MTPLERCRAYMAKLPPAVEGQGGDKQTLDAALVCHDFGLNETDGMTVLREYNGRCLPPWGEAQLLVKLRSAGRSARKRAGWRLEASRPTPVKAAPAEPEPWPDLRSPTNDEMRIIAKLRTLPVSILASARTWGILWSCRYGQTSTPAYAIKTAESCQLRKMDGSPWQFRDGHTCKTRNLRGRPVGWLLSPGTENVLLVEGLIAFLEGLAAVDLAGAEKASGPAWSILAAPQAGAQLPPDILEQLHGRNVRVCPDNDAAGRRAVGAWLGQLQPVASALGVIEPPAGAKDLGDWIKQEPETLTSIFEI